jgi:3,4-dihydroxy 2-butanone 4-phosphate synthase/GTP cyclohydrolase II
VLVRAGQTEASVDLAKLAGFYPAGVICEIMNDDGTMSRMPDLEQFAAKHNLTIISVAQLIEYRRRREKLVNRISHARLPTDFGEFSIIGYQDIINGDQHVAVVKGEVSGDEPTLVRVQSECLTGDVFASRRCDCGSQLRQAFKIIGRTGKGAIVYLRGHEGRGIGLHNKIRAYELQDLGRDTVEANAELGFPADMRHYGIGAQIVVDLGIRRMKLLSNNPRKFTGLQGYGLEVERIPLLTPTNSSNREYLRAKKEKLGHLLELVEQVAAEEAEVLRSRQDGAS